MLANRQKNIRVLFPRPQHKAARCAWLAVLATLFIISGCVQEQDSNPSIRGQFVQFSVGAPENRLHALEWIKDHWQPGFEAMAIEALSFSGGRESRDKMVELLERKTGQSLGGDTDAWQRWLWRDGPRPHPRYAEVKASYYAMVDVSYREYFRNSPNTDIRLDEVQWIGLRRSDDLPPLTRPVMQAANDSGLDDDEIIVGVVLNNQARAYARGLIAQHGVVRDEIDENHFMLVNDTLTGSAAAYLLADEQHALAASGFLHRGDTLLYDPTTQSLWSSLRGRPVVGPLVAQNIQLKQLPAVTTQWGEWRNQHPDSRVTADDPSEQDYLIGQAKYRQFVAADRLVESETKPNLKAHTQVLGLTQNGHALAIPLRFLLKHRIYQKQLGTQIISVLTSHLGASRAYLTDDVTIQKWLSEAAVADSNGQSWQVSEQALINDAGTRLPRLPVRHAHWLAWQGAYPDTQVAE